jgi:dTMP kinase
MKGKFITFEGPEGSGKSTQMDMLYSHLLKKGYDCIKTHEPGGTRVGEMIRRIVLGAREENITDTAELLLILADRAQHTQEIILPALNEGKIVLCDRYNDSTMAYQGYGRGLDLAEVRRLCDYASLGLKPDLTFLLDVDVSVGLSRTKKRHGAPRGAEPADRFESERREFHERLRAGYLSLAKEEPHRIILLDPSEDLEAIHRQIVNVIERILKNEQKAC